MIYKNYKNAIDFKWSDGQREDEEHIDKAGFTENL